MSIFGSTMRWSLPSLSLHLRKSRIGEKISVKKKTYISYNLYSFIYSILTDNNAPLPSTFYAFV